MYCRYISGDPIGTFIVVDPAECLVADPNIECTFGDYVDAHIVGGLIGIYRSWW